jgi:hypothetical protein
MMVPILAAAAVLLPTALATRPVRAASANRGFFAAIDHTCRTVGESTVVEIGDYLLAMPLRAWCGAAVGIVAPADAEQALSAIQAANAPLCASVYVVSQAGFPDNVKPLVGEIERVSARSHTSPERTLLSAPDAYTDGELNVYIAPLPLPDSCN